MPKSEIHKKKFKKNVAVLATIVALCAIIWIVTMIRITAGS